jgi:predicted metal-dependent HD superfamily phosphohydrolase
MSNYEKLLHSAATRYAVDINLREYHNFDHAIKVLYAVLEIDPYAGQELHLAALYHDAVYVPKAGEDANERCSAAALLVDARERGFSAEVLQEAADLIIKTSVDWHLHGLTLDPKLSTLLDADLKSLSAPWGEFCDNQLAIIREMGGTVTSETVSMSAKFLQQFLEVRDQIYRTDYARDYWEEKARHNILRYANEFSL